MYAASQYSQKEGITSDGIVRKRLVTKWWAVASSGAESQEHFFSLHLCFWYTCISTGIMYWSLSTAFFFYRYLKEIYIYLCVSVSHMCIIKHKAVRGADNVDNDSSAFSEFLMFNQYDKIFLKAVQSDHGFPLHKPPAHTS